MYSNVLSYKVVAVNGEWRKKYEFCYCFFYFFIATYVFPPINIFLYVSWIVYPPRRQPFVQLIGMLYINCI